MQKKKGLWPWTGSIFIYDDIIPLFKTGLFTKLWIISNRSFYLIKFQYLKNVYKYNSIDRGIVCNMHGPEFKLHITHLFI